ncbi:MAG: hypothetical protein QE277_04065 [Flectobacillus sp.]|nr:hypothetical protein [Flectobacillus sp.]
MGHYIYEDEISELLRNVHNIHKKDVYNYIGTDLETEFEEYFNFCLSNMREECDMFNIQPSFLYFFDEYDTKARATKFEGKYIIEIKYGVVKILHNLFVGSLFFGQDQIIEKYFGLIQIITPKSIPQLMLQYSTLFTYYHELAHLIQKSDYTDNSLLEEIPNQQESEDKRKHILEVDADFFAASNLAQHICQYWDEIKLSNSSVSNNQLYELVVISMASINCYLAYSFQTFPEEIYFYENSHPHAANRLLLILGVINDYIKKHLEITIEDIKLMTLSTIDLAYDILQHKAEEGHQIKSWRDKVSLNMEKIIEYGKEMTVEMGKTPTLASVRILNLQSPNHNN